MPKQQERDNNINTRKRYLLFSDIINVKYVSKFNALANVICREL